MHVVFLSRKEAAHFLSARGLRVSPKTLAKWATTGGGPAYHRFCRKAVYAPEALEVWAKEKLGNPLHSTSDAGAP